MIPVEISGDKLDGPHQNNHGGNAVDLTRWLVGTRSRSDDLDSGKDISCFRPNSPLGITDDRDRRLVKTLSRWRVMRGGCTCLGLRHGCKNGLALTGLGDLHFMALFGICMLVSSSKNTIIALTHKYAPILDIPGVSFDFYSPITSSSWR